MRLKRKNEETCKRKRMRYEKIEYKEEKENGV